MKFTERFNELIESNHTKQTELALHCLITKQAITEMKAGRSFPSLDTLCRIADFFDVTTDYLLGRKEYY